MNWTTHGSADGARIVLRAASRTRIAVVLPHAAARDAAAFEGRAQAETGRIGGAGGWIIPPGEVKGVPSRGVPIGTAPWIARRGSPYFPPVAAAGAPGRSDAPK